MSGHRITFKKLILEGFGPYLERTEFNFSEKINCYVARNERGKTTMVAGLLATFFGLKHRQRSSSYPFTLERFRSWDKPARCRGEVFFAAGKQHYQVARDFDSHQVELWLIQEDFTQKELLVEGAHNPAASKRLTEYEDKLQELLGLNSQELFRDTFCVEQPLPEPKNISTELQGLLSGGRGTAFSGAFINLENSIKTLTRFTGPNNRGITGRNMGRDGSLERLEKEISDLKQRIEDGKQVADSLEEVREQLNSVEVEYGKTKEDLDKKEKTRQAWSKWKLLQNEYLNAAGERDKLSQAETEVGKLQEKQEQLEDQLKRDYPEFTGAPPEAGDHLENLSWLDKQLEEVHEAIRNLQGVLQEDSKELARLKSEETNKYAGWDCLGADPPQGLRTIRRNAETCKKEWTQFQEKEEELRDINNELRERFAPFAHASAETLDLARHYDRHHSQLNMAADKAQQSLTRAEEQKRKHQETQDVFESKYSELLHLPHDVEDTVNEKLSGLKKMKELEGSHQELSRKFIAPIWLRIGVMVFGAGLAGVLAGSESILILSLAIAAAALVGYWAGGLVHKLTKAAVRQELARTGEELRQCSEDLAGLNNVLGQLATADEVELGRLVQRLSQFAEEKEKRRLEEENGRKITEDELEKLRREQENAEKEKKHIDRKMEPFTRSFDDLSDALSQWHSKLERKERLEADLNAQASEIWGCSGESAAGADPFSEEVAGHWQDVARFLQVAAAATAAAAGETPAETPAEQRVAAVAKQLDSLTDEWWQQQKDSAEELSGIKKALNDLDYKIKSNNTRLEELEEKRQGLLNQKTQVNGQIKEIVEKNGDNAAEALRRWKMSQQINNDKNSAALQLKTVLQNNGVEEVEALQSLLSRKEDSVTTSLLRWKEHIDQHPGLPDTEQADNLELITSYLEELEKEIKELDSEKNQQEQTRNELIREQSALEGESPLNIAAAEIELEEMKRQKEKIEIDADALEVAYKELKEAVNDYRQAYKERLEEQASLYCQAVSGVPGRDVVFDDDFNISVREGGRPCAVEQLSKGARDQLYLALRFAVADLLAEEIKLPLIFDDSFTSTDAHRRENIREILQKQADERQFIIMAHGDTFSAWGNKVRLE